MKILKCNSDATSETHKQISFRLPEYLIEALKKEAEERDSSLNSHVAMILLDSIEWEPNEETLKAFDDIEHQRNLEVLDVDNFKSFVASL